MLEVLVLSWLNLHITQQILAQKNHTSQFCDKYED